MNRIEIAMSAALLFLHRRRCLVAVVSPPSSRRRRLIACIGRLLAVQLVLLAGRLSCCVTHLSCHRSGHKLADEPGSCYNHYFYNMLEGPLANRRPLRQGHVSTAVGVEMSAQVVVYDRFLSSLWPLAGR